MALHSNLWFILVLLQSVSITVNAHDDGFMQCETAVKKWASSSLDYEVVDDKHELHDLLFFLHLPRTGGRAFSHCFLRKLYPQWQECPWSYDKLRFDPRNPQCRLLTTHDDYSILSKLPKEKTSVITILRNPIDRVFSTYEFSVALAARFLGYPNSLEFILNNTNKGAVRGTLDVWPWKYLTPWMIQDLFARREARKLKGESHLKIDDPFDMEDVLMPLHEYINHPIARDIVHNEATFQIAGLTNFSFFAESYEVRHCALKYQTLGEYVLQIAKRRLGEMLFVGLTENHKESATMLADMFAAQVISNHTATNSSNDLSDDFQSSLLKNISSYQLTTAKLIEAYDTCVSSLRNSQKHRHLGSLKNIFSVNFTEARGRVPNTIIQEIESLNRLDMELFAYGKEIFAKQQTQAMGSTVYIERLGTNAYSYFYSSSSWRLVCLTITALLLLLTIIFFVNARRTTSKLKL